MSSHSSPHEQRSCHTAYSLNTTPARLTRRRSTKLDPGRNHIFLGRPRVFSCSWAPIAQCHSYFRSNIRPSKGIFLLAPWMTSLSQGREFTGRLFLAKNNLNVKNFKLNPILLLLRIANCKLSWFSPVAVPSGRCFQLLPSRISYQSHRTGRARSSLTCSQYAFAASQRPVIFSMFSVVLVSASRRPFPFLGSIFLDTGYYSVQDGKKGPQLRDQHSP